MKRYSMLLVVFVLACQTTPAPPPVQATAATAVTAEQQLQTIAMDLLNNFVAGRYADAAKDFDTTMMNALGPAKLGEFAKQLTSQAGAYKSVGAPQLTTEQGYRVVVLPATYERANLNVRVVFDGNGKVAGLFFRPAE
jgi:hypothetical protein